MAPFWSAPASSPARATATFSLSWPTAKDAKPTPAEANAGLAKAAKLSRRAAAVKVGQAVRRLARLETGGLQARCVAAVLGEPLLFGKILSFIDIKGFMSAPPPLVKLGWVREAQSLWSVLSCPR